MVGQVNFSSNEIKQINNYLNQGLSGSQIAKKLHKRKQDILQVIRDLQKKPINPVKVTNPKGRIGSEQLDYASQRFTEELYKQGYPVDYIVKLVNAKHPATSKRKILTYIQQFKQQNPDAVDSHKANMKFYKATGKWQKHLDAKFYRETTKHYENYKNQFHEGSDKLIIGVEEDIP